MGGGYIRLYRQIMQWEWWKDIKVYRLFTYMLMVACYNDTEYNGTTIKRGSFVSTIRKMSDATGLTKAEVKDAILHLNDTDEIDVSKFGKAYMFTIKNYDAYQSGNFGSIKSKNSFQNFPQRNYDYDKLENDLTK